MMIKQTISILLILVFFVSCGGGGGDYYHPSVALNPYEIKKIQFANSDVGRNERIEIAGLERVDSRNERYIGVLKYYYFREISFNGEEYTITIPIDAWVSIVNSEGKIVAKLESPRYTRDAVAVELSHPQSQPFLAVLIDQQSSSHSSTLYILDSTFNPIYKEHLLGALWISKKRNPDGDVLFVSTEDRWRPNDECVTIGGNWKYNVFDAVGESHNNQMQPSPNRVG